MTPFLHTQAVVSIVFDPPFLRLIVVDFAG